MSPTKILKRRDEVKPGDKIHSSHGYDLLVTEVLDDAETRTDDRHVEIKGYLHGKVGNTIKNERYPAGSTIEVYTLTWSDAVEQAMKPTDFDLKMDAYSAESILGQKKRINDDGTELVDVEVIRHRATRAYIEAHEGELVEVTFIDRQVEKEFEASGLRQYSRAIYTVSGELKSQTLRIPNFKGADIHAFVVGDAVVPYEAVSSIKVDGDHSALVL